MISKSELIKFSTTALSEQVKFNDKRYIKRDEKSEINITIGTQAPSNGIWFRTFTLGSGDVNEDV